MNGKAAKLLKQYAAAFRTSYDDLKNIFHATPRSKRGEATANMRALLRLYWERQKTNVDV